MSNGAAPLADAEASFRRTLDEATQLVHPVTPMSNQYAHLLSGPDPVPAPRLPQDYRDGVLRLGGRLKRGVYVVRSERTIITAEAYGAVDYGLGQNRFSREGITRFLDHQPVSGSKLINRLETFIRRFVSLPDE